MASWSPAVEARVHILVRGLMERSDRAHDFEHVQRVVKNAKILMRQVQCRPDILVPAAYFHDVVSRYSKQGYSSAVSASASVAGKHLKAMDFLPEQIADIQTCICTASWEHAVSGKEPESLEARILRDADLLEATGAHGLARVFCFAGNAAIPLRWIEVDLDSPPRLPPNLQDADPTPFYHFFSKLLWLNELFHTPQARAEGDRRRKILVDFLREYSRELAWSEGPG